MENRGALFKRIDNALFDMQAATSQTFEQPFLTYARALADTSLESINQELVANLDVDLFLDESSKSRGGMGSARLAWPASADDVLGLKWLLIQKLALEPQDLLGFAHTYYTVGTNLTGELRSLTRQLLIPFARDYKDYVMTLENSERVASADSGVGVNDRSHTQINFHINGNNARVNNHSIDNSINYSKVTTTVTNHISALREEIMKAHLSDEERAAAIDVVDEVESQIESGKPKRAILGALLSSLPAIDSITSISNNLIQALRSTGII